MQRSTFLEKFVVVAGIALFLGGVYFLSSAVLQEETAEQDNGPLTPVVIASPEPVIKEEPQVIEEPVKKVESLPPVEEKVVVAASAPEAKSEVADPVQEESQTEISQEEVPADNEPNVKALSPDIFESRKDAASGKGAATISWTTIDGATDYEVFISQQENFNGAKGFFTKKSKYLFMVYFEKKYFWKVRAVDKQLKPTSAFSKTFSFKVIEKKSLKRVAKDP